MGLQETSEPLEVSKGTLLWVDDEPPILEMAQRALRGFGFKFIGTTDLEVAREHLRSGELSVLVADQVLKRGTGIELLEYAKAVSPGTSRIILTAWTTDQLVEEAINRASVFRFVTKPWDDEELLRDLDLAYNHHQITVERYRLLKKIRHQNAKLEEFNLNLERLVYARTHKEEESKRHSEKTLQALRDTLRFINDVSQAVSVEDILYRLSKDFRKFPSARPPILGFLDSENSPVLYFLQGKQATEKRLTSKWQDSLEPRSNVEQDRKFLANVLGRPLAQLLIFPLKSPQQTFVFGSPVLFIEHSLSSEDLKELKIFLDQRIQPLSLALDRVLMESYLTLTSYRWAQTFDGFKDPIAILGPTLEVDRANRSFFQSGLSEKGAEIFGLLSLQDFSSPHVLQRQIRVGERQFHLTSYPILLHGQSAPTNRVNYYSESTEKNRLQQRLIQNEKMSAVGLLAGNIAHELNNPLTGIRSLTQVLLREVDAKNQLHGDLKEIEQAVGRCEGIINSLQNFSQTGSEDRLLPVDLAHLTAATLSFLKTAMRDHRTEIELEGASVTVLVEPHLMQQTIFNLVNNACQAMDKPGTLGISLEVEKGKAYLRISDTGPGIADQHLSHIFDPFYTTKEEGQGTGLGLSMSRSAVEKFGGEIRVETTVGEGTTFTVILPVVDE